MTPKPQENITINGSQLNHDNGHVNNAFEITKSTNDLPSAVIVKSITKDEKEINSINNVVSVTQTLDFDDLLPHIGEFGRYQKILFILMIPFAFFVAFVYFSQIFITLVPDEHYCRVPELENLSRSDRLEFFFFVFF